MNAWLVHALFDSSEVTDSKLPAIITATLSNSLVPVRAAFLLIAQAHEGYDVFCVKSTKMYDNTIHNFSIL